MIAEHTPDGDLCPECKGSGIRRDATWYSNYGVPVGVIGPVFGVACDNCIDGYLPRCSICGELLQHVRPGKWQCVNEHGEEQGG